MAFRHISRQRHISPVVTGGLAAAFLLFPRSTLHAEAPPEDQLDRKPIYDDPAPIRRPPKSKTSKSNDESTRSATLTGQLSDQLAEPIGHARKFIYVHALLAEDRVNALMSSFFHLEQAFTQTIASLAPPPQTHEKVVPGAVYVLVAAMAGSIVSRNRNILLRASVPFAVGIGTAWVVLPHTTRNVADLVWTFEEKAPIIAENHMRIRGAAEEGWRQTKTRVNATTSWLDEKTTQSQENIKGWMRKEK